MVLSVMVGTATAMYFQSNQPQWYKHIMMESTYGESVTEMIAFAVTLSIIVASMIGTHIIIDGVQAFKMRRRTKDTHQ